MLPFQFDPLRDLWTVSYIPQFLSSWTFELLPLSVIGNGPLGLEVGVGAKYLCLISFLGDAPFTCYMVFLQPAMFLPDPLIFLYTCPVLYPECVFSQVSLSILHLCCY